MRRAYRSSVASLPPVESDRAVSGEYVLDSWRISEPAPALSLMPKLNRSRAPAKGPSSRAPAKVPSARPEEPVSVARIALLPPPAPVRSRSVVMVDQNQFERSIAAFAGFGPPPEKLRETPAYAFHVFRRRWTLRRELASARDRNSNDIAIYEQAIGAADSDGVRAGILVIVCAVVLAAIAIGAVAIAI